MDHRLVGQTQQAGFHFQLLLVEGLHTVLQEEFSGLFTQQICETEKVQGAWIAAGERFKETVTRILCSVPDSKSSAGTAFDIRSDSYSDSTVTVAVSKMRHSHSEWIKEKPTCITTFEKQQRQPPHPKSMGKCLRLHVGIEQNSEGTS